MRCLLHSAHRCRSVAHADHPPTPTLPHAQWHSLPASAWILASACTCAARSLAHAYYTHSIYLYYPPALHKEVGGMRLSRRCLHEPKGALHVPLIRVTESTLTARSWSFASSLANSLSVALSDGMPLEGLMRCTFWRFICVAMPPTPFIKSS